MQYCKIGKTTPVLPKIFDLKRLEAQLSIANEEAYNVRQTDSGMSDVLYYEAQKLKQQILHLRKVVKSTSVF